MNSITIEFLNGILRKRFNNLIEVDTKLFKEELILFYNFLETDFIISNILYDLRLKHSSLIVNICDSLSKKEKFESKQYIEKHLVTLCILEYNKNHNELDNIVSIMAIYMGYKHGNPPDPIKIFIHYFIKPFVEHLSESIDQNIVILAICKRFKQKCEVFRQERYLDIYLNDTARGEANLANIFYEFLFDESYEMHIEPKINSGSPDLVIKLNNKQIIADIKIFTGNKKYIQDAVNQLRTYLKEKNESFGFLVIYEVCEKNLAIQTNTQCMDFSYIFIDGKTIFFIIIDLFEYQKTASKRGIAQIITIDESEFVQ